jgi:hypothetical protein
VFPPSENGELKKGLEIFMMIRSIVILVILLSAAYAAPVHLIAEDDARRTAPIFEVPTSGTIMDVTYRPEFDEWWVKCREGDSVVVYSYDPEAKKWGKVRFVRKKPDSGKATVVPTRSKSEKEQPKKPDPRSGRTDKAVEKKDAVNPPASEKEPVTTKQETKKANWWDLRNVLKSGQKLINPFKGDQQKPPAKPDDTVPGG